ncbi:MAG TPA: hypothetical protein VNX25_06790 [Verrucomicrobiae bacterium]|nr:hypothetical protein [Verrucomicrobiae bacterium]
MSRRTRERAAAEAATAPEVVERLEQLLDTQQQRVWVVCSIPDCRHHENGHCTLFSQGEAPRMKPGVPCDRFEAASAAAAGEEH